MHTVVVPTITIASPLVLRAHENAKQQVLFAFIKLYNGLAVSSIVAFLAVPVNQISSYTL
jgi:hypothetical protein